MNRITSRAKYFVIANLTILLMTLPSYALTTADGFGSTPKEALDMAKANAADMIASRGGRGCLGRKEGGVIYKHWKEGNTYWVSVYVSEHRGTCRQNANSVNIFGVKIPF